MRWREIRPPVATRLWPATPSPVRALPLAPLTPLTPGRRGRDHRRPATPTAKPRLRGTPAR
jgi:hypothetical protein